MLRHHGSPFYTEFAHIAFVDLAPKGLNRRPRRLHPAVPDAPRRRRAGCDQAVKGRPGSRNVDGLPSCGRNRTRRTGQGRERRGARTYIYGVAHPWQGTLPRADMFVLRRRPEPAPARAVVINPQAGWRIGDSTPARRRGVHNMCRSCVQRHCGAISRLPAAGAIDH